MSTEGAVEGLPKRSTVQALVVAAAMMVAAAVAAYIRPDWTLFTGRFLLTAILGALVVYQAILAMLGYRGRRVGPRTEERIWLENASVGLALLAVIVVVWLP